MSIGSYLRNSVQQVVGAHVSIETWFKAGACEFVVRSMEISQEDLVVMVGVEQGPYVAGKLVKPGESDPLFLTSVIVSFVVQLWMNTDQRLEPDRLKMEGKHALTSTR